MAASRIYYAKSLKDLGMGWEYIKKHLPELKTKLESLDFSETHDYLTLDYENNLDILFLKYQNNNNVAEIVKRKKLSLTSMSVVDIVII